MPAVVAATITLDILEQAGGRGSVRQRHPSSQAPWISMKATSTARCRHLHLAITVPVDRCEQGYRC